MSEEKALQFYKALKIFLNTTSNEERNAIGSQILEMGKCDGSFFDILLLYQIKRDMSDSERHFSIILIARIIDYYSNLYNDPQKIEQIKVSMLNIIVNEEKYLLRCKLCECLCVFFKKIYDKNAQWHEFYDFANTMLQDHNLCTTGFFMWQQIVSHMNCENIVPILPFLLQNCSQAMHSDSIEMRKVGTELLVAISGHKVDYSNMIEQIVEPMIVVLKKTFYIEKEQDVSTMSIYEIAQNAHHIACLIAEAISSPNGYFDNYKASFAHLGIEFLADKSLPLLLRVAGYDLIENDSENMDGCISILEGISSIDNIKPYLDLFVNLMIELLAFEQEYSSFEFAQRFFHFAGATVEGSAVFDYVWSVCINLYRNLQQIEQNGQFQSNTYELPQVPHLPIICKVVSLFLLISIVESQQDYFAEHIIHITKFVTSTCNIDNDDVLQYVFRLFQEVAEYIPYALPIIVDNITEFICGKLAFQEALNTLDIVLSKCKRPLKNLPQFIQNLINLLPQANEQQIEGVISCITSSISSSNNPIEEIYKMICPILNECLATKPDLQYIVLRCFGNLSKAAPLSIISDVPNICKLIRTIVQGNNFKLTTEAFCTLRQLVKNMPLSITPFANEFVQILLQLLQAFPIKTNDDEGDQDGMMHLESFSDANVNDDTQDQNEIILNLQTSLLECISTFIQTMPEQMSSFAPAFFSYLENAPKINDSMTVPVCHSIRISARGFKQLGINLFDIMTCIVNQLRNLDNKKTIIEIHNTISKLMLVYGLNPEKNMSIIQTINFDLMQGLGGEYVPGYLMFELAGSIDNCLVPPIFKCLNIFITTLGHNIIPYAENIIKTVDIFLQSMSRAISALAIETYSRLCSLLVASDPETAEGLFQKSLSTIFQTLSIKNFFLQERNARSLRILLSINTEHFINNQQALMKYTEVMIKLSSIFEYSGLKWAIISFWCSFIMILQISPNEEPLRYVLSSLPPPPNDESLISVAPFCLLAEKNWPDLTGNLFYFVAASVMASEEGFLVQMDQNIIVAIVQRLQSLSKEELSQYVFHNQGKLVKIIQNLQHFSRS